jgi:uncharacterized protein YqeY
MSLKEQIKSELITAMKAKDEFKLSVLRLVNSAVKNKEIDLGHELSDDEITAVIRTMVKQGKDAMVDFKAGERADLVEKQEKEIQLLEQYLPQALSADEIEKICAEAIQESGASTPADMGKAMGLAMKKTAGRADGLVVKEIIQKLLQ